MFVLRDIYQKIPLKEWKAKPQMGEDIFKMHHWQKELLQTIFFLRPSEGGVWLVVTNFLVLESIAFAASHIGQVMMFL